MSSDNAALRPARHYVPQPQWNQFVMMRDHAYSHTQPQWLDVQKTEQEETHTKTREGTSLTLSELQVPQWLPIVVRPPPFEARRVCITCHLLKEMCSCKTCHVCKSTFLKNRHHCRRCWRAVCSNCWGYKHYVHMLGNPMMVCDRCSVPWALANASKRDESGLLWGLYALRIAGEMPRMCITPCCRTFTRRLTCYICELPTVSMQPHVSRVVRPNGVSAAAMETVNVIDMQQLSLRAMEVNGMTTADVERVFRSFFHNYEEVLAFRTVTNAKAAQCILLSNIAAAVAYEYVGAPNITLGLSDIPYARLLQVTVSRERYTVLEAPGRVKFITFPGTHSWRTRLVDMRFSRVEETVWTRLHEGLCPGPCPPSELVPLCGGVRKTWAYQVHGGFAQEAREVGLPLEELLEDVRRGGYSLVLCGHSLGGAIAQYLSMQLLHKAAALLVPTDPMKEPKLMCVTFGAPLLGNYELADHIHDCGWSHLFHNFVYRSDVVPRLLCMDELVWDAQSRLANSFTSVFASAQNWWRGKSNANENNNSNSTKGPAMPDTLSAAENDATAAPTSSESLDGSCEPSTESEGPLLAPPTVVNTRRAIPAVLSKVTTTTSALSLRFSGGVSEGTMIAEANEESSDLAADASAAGSDAEDEARITAYTDTAIRTSRDFLEEEESGEGSEDSGVANGPNYWEKRKVDAVADTAATAAQNDADVEAALNAFTSRCNLRNGSHDASCASCLSNNNSRNNHDEDDVVDGGDKCVKKYAMDNAAVVHDSHNAAPLPTPSADVTVDVVIPNRRMHRRFTCFGRYHFFQYGKYGYVSTDDSETAFGILKHGCGESVVLHDHSVAAYNRGLMIHLYRNLD